MGSMDERMVADLPGPRLSATEEISDYRSISAWAVVGTIAGAASFLSLAHPSLWLIPLFALACSVLALVKISLRPDLLFGRRLALLGIGLGIFFLICAPLRYYGERYLLERQAEDYFLAWISLVKDKRFGQAYQATLHPRYRQPDGTDIDLFYRDSPDDRVDQEEYFNFGVAKDLVALGPEVTVRLDATLAILFQGNTQQITQRWFAYKSSDATGEPDLRLHVQVLRTADRDGDYWQLVGLADSKTFEPPVRGRLVR